MPKRKITESLWTAMLAAYTEWDPTGPDKIEDLLAPFGISKQGFYAELRRRGVPTKGRTSPASDRVENQVQAALLEALLTARLRIRVLELELTKHGIAVPI